MDLADGFLIVLGRDAAKQFFGHREDDTRLDFIRELLNDTQITSVSCGGKWQPIHDALCGVVLEGSVLAQAILGGRPMHQGDEFHICMVRPDVVTAVCQQLEQVDTTPLGNLAVEIEAVKSAYRSAADVRGAIVFVAKK